MNIYIYIPMHIFIYIYLYICIYNHIFQLFSSFGLSKCSLQVLRIPDLLQEKYKTIQATALKKMEVSIKENTKISNALKALTEGTGPSTSGANPGRPTPNRTLASPDWDGEPPVNVAQSLSIPTIPVSEFESNNTFLRFEGCSHFSLN